MVNYQAEERKQNLSPSNEEEEEEEENLSQKLSQGLSIAESGEEEGGVGETGDSREEERAHFVGNNQTLHRGYAARPRSTRKKAAYISG